ncbi:hypothetical protein N3K66_001593 [Trichothecium roseum]|uniref:Uncharacterized protein n=1 Tax=Trichothecium roseum TaxID=47278 RepID=A0ACC0VF71_9HYPO|nr:hypothetical protein N3K66_001593 [Trichothecium roseum]
MFIPTTSPLLPILLLLLLLTTTAQSTITQRRRPPPNQPSSSSTPLNHLGCYHPPGITPQTTHPSIYNSVGLCLNRCRAASLPVAALRADQCLCASSRPPRVALAAASQCDRPCPGYALEMCGGREAFSVYSTGEKEEEEEPEADDNDSGYEEDDFPGGGDGDGGLGQRISDSTLGSAYGAAADAAAQLAKAAQDFISACLGSRGGTRLDDKKRPSKQRPAAAGHDSFGGWRETGLGKMGQINHHGGTEQMPIKGL